MTSRRAGAAPVFPNVCASPAGTNTNVPLVPWNTSSAMRNSTAPSKTKYASSFPTWLWAGGILPPGGNVLSINERRPWVFAAVALNHISLPRASRRRPSPLPKRSTTHLPRLGFRSYEELGSPLVQFEEDSAADLSRSSVFSMLSRL